MEQYLVVQDVAAGEILPGLPTPRLIDQTSRTGPAEAYYKDGIVYMRDAGYESPDGTYTRVRVIRNPEFQEYP